jgi:hypothetical protein
MSLRKITTFSAVAVVTALSVWYFAGLAKTWDSPPTSTHTVKQDVTFNNRAVKVTISCVCPDALVASQTAKLTVQIHLGGLPVIDEKSAKWAYQYFDASTGISYNSISFLPIFSNFGLVRQQPRNLSKADIEKLPLVPTGADLSFQLNVRGAHISARPSDVTFDASDLASPNDVEKTVKTFELIPGADFKDINFLVKADSDKGSQELGAIILPLKTHQPFAVVIVPILYGFAWFLAFFSTLLTIDWRIRIIRKRTELRLSEATARADANPERARFAWEVAKVKLEAYFDRNLIQVNLVFWVAVFVMTVGFGFVLGGVILSFHNSEKAMPSASSLVAAISGIITQFIGATFMVIYRSTMSQASQFMTVLERINSVGMAVQVLDSIPEAQQELKNATRAQIVELLLTTKDRSVSLQQQGQQPS